MKFPSSRFSFFRRRERDEDLRRELQSHVDSETQEQIESGVPSEEARYAARRAFGNTLRTAEDARESWGGIWLERLLRDVRYAARGLRKAPGFTIVAVLTLALGIGANSAIFSVIDALMLRPLPFPAADQLVRISSTKQIGGRLQPIGPSALDVRDFSQMNHSFQRLIAYDTWRKNVSFGDSNVAPEQMRVGLIPSAYFEILGVQPMMGRLFANDEYQPGRNRVAAISARVWKDRFAGDPEILHRKIIINDEPYAIIAVMPIVVPEWMEPGRPGPVEVWTPVSFLSGLSESVRGARGDTALGRLKPGVSLKQAQTDLSTIAGQLAAAHPIDHGIGVAVMRLADTRVGAMRPMLLLLTAAVILILLIACVNLANLLLARNSARQRELAVRAALGSGRAGLVRHLLTETSLIALTGGAAGLVLAQIGVKALDTMPSESFPQLASVEIDWRIFLFTFAVSVAACLLVGVAPALTGTRLNLVDALKQGGRSGGSGTQAPRMRTILVVSEIAMSLLLVLGASLLVQSMMRLESQTLGIRQEHLLKGHFYMPPFRYPDAGAITRFCDAFGTKIRVVPGVIDASVTTLYPPNNGWSQMLDIPGHPAARIQDVPSAQFGVVDAHFLRTLGIPLIQGRDFADSDTATTPPVALINQEFKRAYFPRENPVGRQIHIGPPPFLQIRPGENISDSADVTIVGIIGDFRNSGLAVPPEPQIVGLYSQHPFVNYGFKDVVIRAASDPKLLAPEIRRQLQSLDADMPFAEVKTIDEIVDQQTGGQRFATALLVLFAAAGLVLAIVGIYGVVSYLVGQRTQELAVRMAVGAGARDVLWLVLRQGLNMAIVGSVVGLVGAAAAHGLLRGILFDVSPVDPTTFVTCTAFLLLIALLASVIPGARATRIDLVRALRQE